MDLPVLNQLEKIYTNQDSGAQAINKLVRNQNIIVQGIEDAQLIEGPQGPEGPQGEQGYPGNSPYIGENGNWWINNTDTGVSANAAISVQELQEQINDLKGNITKIDVTLLNGWSNLDGGTTTVMTAHKNGNLVFISGILQTGTKTENTVIGVLPTGYRPSKVLKQTQDQYSTANQFTRCAFNVDANGNIYISGVTQSYVVFNMTIPIG